MGCKPQYAPGMGYREEEGKTSRRTATVSRVAVDISYYADEAGL